MNDCPTCGLPMTWSDDQMAYWCCVYGTHSEQPRNVVIGAKYPGSVVRVDFHKERRTG